MYKSIRQHSSNTWFRTHPHWPLLLSCVYECQFKIGTKRVSNRKDSNELYPNNHCNLFFQHRNSFIPSIHYEPIELDKIWAWRNVLVFWLLDGQLWCWTLWRLSCASKGSSFSASSTFTLCLSIYRMEIHLLITIERQQALIVMYSGINHYSHPSSPPHSNWASPRSLLMLWPWKEWKTISNRSWSGVLDLEPHSLESLHWNPHLWILGNWTPSDWSLSLEETQERTWWTEAFNLLDLASRALEQILLLGVCEHL